MRKPKYTKEFLSPIVHDSYSWAETIRGCGLEINGGNYRMIQKCVRYHQIDISHFTGQAWCKGETKETDIRVARIARKNRRSYSEMLIENAPPSISSNRLREAILSTGMEERCAIDGCGITEWMGKPITLHMDHINGINNDNRIENLRFLCPNCHQQTPTWGNKK